MERKKEKGFTLIEIIAVLVILGILAAVAVPKFSNMQKEAKKKAAQSLIAGVQSGLSLKYSEELLKYDGNIDNAWSALTDGDCNTYVTLDGYDDYSCSMEKKDNVITITVKTPDGETVEGNFTKPQ